VNQSYTNIIDDLRLLQAPPVWAYVAVGVLVLALGAAVAYVLWKRAHPTPGLPLSPAAVAALQEDTLAELAKLHHLIAVENSRPYAIGVSAVVRRYIERRFAIRAPWRSTEEFLAEAKLSPLLDERHRGHLTRFLSCCDFLKFAKASAEVSELEMIHAAAVHFVKDTEEAQHLVATHNPAAGANPAGPGVAAATDAPGDKKAPPKPALAPSQPKPSA